MMKDTVISPFGFPATERITSTEAAILDASDKKLIRHRFLGS